MNNRITYNGSYYVRQLFEECSSKETNKDDAEVKDLGLLEGITGVAIIYYLLSQQLGYGYKNLQEKGTSILDYVGENSFLIDGSDFNKGITGIGWTIEWLVQNGFINDTNTDEILVSIDDVLYKAISYSKDNNISLFNGLLGKLWYFLKRASSANPATHYYKRIGHLECIVMLTDDIESIINTNECILTENKLPLTNIEKKSFLSIIDASIILTTVSGVHINVNSPTLNAILNTIVQYTENKLSDLKYILNNKNNYLDFLYLAISYLIAAKKQDHPTWELKARKYIELIIDSFKTLNESQIADPFKKLVVFSLLNLHVPKDEYKKEVEFLIKELSSADLPDSIYKGRGCLVIAELCLHNKEMVENWHEIFFIE